MLGFRALCRVAYGRDPGHTDTLQRSVSKSDAAAVRAARVRAFYASDGDERVGVLPRLLECFAEQRGRLGAGDAVLAVDDEEGNACDPQSAGLGKVVPNLGNVLVRGEQLGDSIGAEAQIGTKRRQVVTASNVLAMLEMVAEQAFLGNVLLSVGGSEVDQAVGRETIGHNDVVELVVQTHALGLFRYMGEHLLDLLGCQALSLAEIVQFRA